MAIFLGSSNFNGSNGSHFVANVYLDSYTQDKTNNTTSYKLHLYAGSVDGWTGYGVAINGYLQGVATGSTTSFPARTQVDLGTYSGILQHDTNGVGILNVSAYVDASAWSGVGIASINTKYSFPTIPRKANISGQNTAVIESTYTININILVDNYNYTLRYSITDDDNVVHTDTIATGINQDSYEWTIPEIFYQYWTTDTRDITIFCDTYNGTSLLGTTQITPTLMVPTKAAPKIIEATFTDENPTTVELTGDSNKMIKGYSKAKFFAVAELNYYAKTEQVYLVDDRSTVNYTIEKGETAKKQTISFDKTFTNFDIRHFFMVFDTRHTVGGVIARTPSMNPASSLYTQIVYNVIDYIPLTLNMSTKRPQATTGEVTVEFSGNYFNSSFGAVTNTLELSWKYRQKGVETWTDGGTFIKDTDYEITGNTFNSKGAISLGNVFDYRNIYEIAIYYKDKLVDTYTSKTVTKGLPIFWWNKDGVYDGNNKKFLVEGDVSGGDILPIGSMIPYGNDTAPENWLICDGSEVSRTTYAELFNVIGISYGSGDGSTTFNLPNKKGRVSVGFASDDSDFNSIGKHDGEKTHTLTVNEMPSHNHGVYGSPYGSATWIEGIQRVKYDVNTKTASDTYKLYEPILNNGGGQAHNNLQPYEVDNWIIKASKTTSTPTKSEVTNTYSKSENSVYSCNYINAKLDALYKMMQ